MSAPKPSWAWEVQPCPICGEALLGRPEVFVRGKGYHASCWEDQGVSAPVPSDASQALWLEYLRIWATHIVIVGGPFGTPKALR